MPLVMGLFWLISMVQPALNTAQTSVRPLEAAANPELPFLTLSNYDVGQPFSGHISVKSAGE